MDKGLLSVALILMLVLTAFFSGAGLARHSDAGFPVAGVTANDILVLPGQGAPAENCAIMHCGDHLAFIAIPDLVTPRASVIVPTVPVTGWRENAVTRDPEPPRA